MTVLKNLENVSSVEQSVGTGQYGLPHWVRIPVGQCHRSQRPTGGYAAINGQLKVISPPPPLP